MIGVYFEKFTKKSDYMKKVQNMIETANDLFEQAEAAATESLAKGYHLFKQGIALLFQAFLTAEGIEANGDLFWLFNECRRLEPSFEAIEAEVEQIIEADSMVDAEELSDIANEIWDFVIDLAPGDYY
jgi:hypothetical protein